MLLKKSIAIFLVLVIVVALLPFSTFAVERESDNGGGTELVRVSGVLEMSHALHEMIESHEPEAARDGDPSEYATARLLVVGGTNLDTKGAVSHAYGYRDWHIIQYKTPDEARKAAELLKDQPGVKSVVSDSYCREQIFDGDEASPLKVPVTPEGLLSWGFRQSYMNVRDYQNWMLEQYGGDESALPEIKVAVIGSGCDLDHDFVEDRLVQGYDFWDEDMEPQDENGWGTFLSGVIVDGTLSNVKIMPLRVSGRRGGADSLLVLLAMDYACEQGCKVAYVSSICSPYLAAEFEEMVNSCTDRGMICAVTSGSGDPASWVPAFVPRAFTVASMTTSFLQNELLQNYGELVDGFAAGESVMSAFLGGGSNGSLYADRNDLFNTPIAASHGAAACALVFSAYPDMLPDDVMNTLRFSCREMHLEEVYTGALDLTDLFVYDPFVDTDACGMHFISNSECPWTAEGDNTLRSGLGMEAGETSILEGRGKFTSYQEVSFDYRIVGSGTSLTVNVDGDTQLAVAADTDGWRTATLLIPGFNTTMLGKGGISLKWEVKNISGGTGYAEVRNITRHDTISSVFSHDSNVPLYLENDPALDQWELLGTDGWICAGDYSSDTIAELSATISLYRKARIAFSYNVTGGGEFQFLVNGEPVLSADNGSDSFLYITPAADTYTFTFRYSGQGSAQIRHHDNGEVNQVYDENCVSKLRDFLEQTDENGVKNGEKISADYDPDYVDSWGVVWGSTNGFNMKVRAISWDGKSLVGDLDLSNFRELSILSIVSNMISSLNLTGCFGLQELYCSDNNLEGIDFGKDTEYPGLRQLYISDNNLSGILDLSYFTGLEVFSCSNNRLTGINLDSCTNLVNLQCRENNLMQLNLTNCRKLADLYCDQNKLTTLDLSACRRLKYFRAAENKLISLDLSNNPMLYSVCVDSNPLTELDLSNHSSIEDLIMTDLNSMTSLDVSGCSGLKTIILNGFRSLTSLNLSGCTSMSAISLYGSNLDSLDLSEFSLLRSIYFENITLNSLDLSGCESLNMIQFMGCNMPAIDLSGKQQLTEVISSYSSIASMNLFGCSSIKKVDLIYTNLDTLDISGCSTIESVDCSGLCTFIAEDTPLKVKRINTLGGKGRFWVKNNSTEFYLFNWETPAGWAYRGIYDADMNLITADAELSLYGNELSQVLEEYTFVYYDCYQAQESITVEPIIVPVGSSVPISYSFSPLTASNFVIAECLQSNIASVTAINGYNTYIPAMGDYVFLCSEYLISGVSPGRTTLVIRSPFDDSVYGYATVEVVESIPDYITVQPVDITRGESTTVSYSIFPSEFSNAPVVFSVADSTVASVDSDGIIRGLVEGETTVTVSYAYDPSIFATASVTVTEIRPSTILVDDITVDTGWYEPLSVSVLPSTAYNMDVTYEWSEPGIAEITEFGMVHGLAIGTVTLTVRSVSAPSVFGTATVTVTEPVDYYISFSVPSFDYEPGETVTLPVTIEGNYAVNVINLSFDICPYSWMSFEIIPGPVCEEITALGGSVETSSGYFAVSLTAALPTTPLTMNGILFYVSFRIPDYQEFYSGSLSVHQLLYAPVDGEPVPIRHLEFVGGCNIQPVSYTLGDVNEDGTVNATDALVLMRYLMNAQFVSQTGLLAADVNCDGTIDMIDVLMILRYVLEIIPGFGQ